MKSLLKFSAVAMIILGATAAFASEATGTLVYQGGYYGIQTERGFQPFDSSQFTADQQQEIDACLNKETKATYQDSEGVLGRLVSLECDTQFDYQSN